jgi:chromosome segregation ATPase
LPHSAAERGGLDYYALYDVVAAQFPLVRMLGQMPFVGYAIVDFATENAPEPTLDAGFVPNGAEEPEWFCALASEQPQRLDEFAIVQLPFRSALGSTPSAWLEQQLRTAQLAEKRSRGRMAEVEAENARLAEALRGQPGASGGRAELVTLRRELEQKEAWIRELEARAATADERADQTQSELDEERAHGAALRELLETERSRAGAVSEPAAGSPATTGVQSAEFEAELARHATRTSELESTLIERDARLVELDRTVGELRAKLTELSRGDEEDATRQIDALERMLSERGAELTRTLGELKESERIGRELVRELEAMQSAPVASGEPQTSAELARLRAKLERLAALNAEREADLTAARWTIEKLEANIADLGSEPFGREPVVDPTRGDAMRHELERQLSLAQAELQRQAALIDQLRERRAATRLD